MKFWNLNPECIFKKLPLRSKKAGRFEKLHGFARSHFIVTRGSVSLSCATTPHPSYFSKYSRYYKDRNINFLKINFNLPEKHLMSF